MGRLVDRDVGSVLGDAADARHDVVGLIDLDGGADANAERGDDRRVVQRGTRDGQTVDEDRVVDGRVGDVAGAADALDDVADGGGGGVGLVLVGGGPAGCAAGRAELVADARLDGLEDEAVGRVGEGVGLVVRAEGEDAGDGVGLAAVAGGDGGAEGEAGLSELSVVQADGIERDEGELDAVLQVVLADGASGGVAGVGEGGLAGSDAVGVRVVEVVAGHQELAADVDGAGLGDGAGESGDVELEDVRGEDLAGDAVAAGGDLDEGAVVVAGVEGHAVDLRLHADGAAGRSDAFGEGLDVGEVGDLVEGEHGDVVGDGSAGAGASSDVAEEAVLDDAVRVGRLVRGDAGQEPVEEVSDISSASVSK